MGELSDQPCGTDVTGSSGLLAFVGEPSQSEMGDKCFFEGLRVFLTKES